MPSRLDAVKPVTRPRRLPSHPRDIGNTRMNPRIVNLKRRFTLRPGDPVSEQDLSADSYFQKPSNAFVFQLFRLRCRRDVMNPYFLSRRGRKAVTRPACRYIPLDQV